MPIQAVGTKAAALLDSNLARALKLVLQGHGRSLP